MEDKYILELTKDEIMTLGAMIMKHQYYKKTDTTTKNLTTKIDRVCRSIIEHN